LTVAPAGVSLLSKDPVLAMSFGAAPRRRRREFNEVVEGLAGSDPGGLANSVEVSGELVCCVRH
jgi:hypothetical protein